MKENTTVRALYRLAEQYMDQKVTVSGWIRTLRDQKQFGFISLNDGTFFSPLQIVFNRDQLANYDEIARLGTCSAIIATGRIVPTPSARQPFEMQSESIRIEGASSPDYPLQPKRHTPEYLRTIAHLRPRTNLMAAVFSPTERRLPCHFAKSTRLVRRSGQKTQIHPSTSLSSG